MFLLAFFHILYDMVNEWIVLLLLGRLGDRELGERKRDHGSGLLIAEHKKNFYRLLN